MRSFAISTDRIGPKRYWVVRIHRTVDELRSTACRYRNLTPDRLTNVWGYTHPTSYRLDPEGTRHYPPNGFAGVIRFVEGCTTAEIVAHELLHAAVWTLRMVDPDPVLGSDYSDTEEALAYIHGQLAADMDTKLRGTR